MKTINLTIILLLFSALSLKAQEDKNKEKKIITTQFKVEGVCGMCEERIENALSVKGIKAADWNRETHMCEVTYRSDKISIDEIHKLLNEVGHDTEKSKATEEQYSKVHECCKYREDHDH